MDYETTQKIKAAFIGLRSLLGNTRPDLHINLRNMEVACISGKSFKYARPAKRITRTSGYIRKVTKFLLRHDGPQSQKVICLSCGIPLGSTVPVFSDKRFQKVEGGQIVLAPTYQPPADLQPKFYYQDEIRDILRAGQPMKVMPVAIALGVSYPTARKELDSGAFHSSTDGYWLPLKPNEEVRYDERWHDCRD